MDTYGHLIPGANRQAVDRLDDATERNLYATSTLAKESPMILLRQDQRVASGPVPPGGRRTSICSPQKPLL